MPFPFKNKIFSEEEKNQNDLIKGKFFFKPILFPKKSFLFTQNENKFKFNAKTVVNDSIKIDEKTLTTKEEEVEKDKKNESE